MSGPRPTQRALRQRSGQAPTWHAWTTATSGGQPAGLRAEVAAAAGGSLGRAQPGSELALPHFTALAGSCFAPLAQAEFGARIGDRGGHRHRRAPPAAGQVAGASRFEVCLALAAVHCPSPLHDWLPPQFEALFHVPCVCRFALGHFDGPGDDNPYRRIPPSVVGSQAHLELARRAAAASTVLLKNDPPAPHVAAPLAATPLLPLRLGQLRRLAVLGPMANRSGEPGPEMCCSAPADRMVAFDSLVSPTLLPGMTAVPPDMTAVLQSTCWAATMDTPPGR